MTEDINDLLDIAIQCPQVGGMSVYQARGLLPIYLRSEYEEFFERCFPDSPIEERSERENLLVKESSFEKVKIYPNPASESIIISHNNNCRGVIKVIDSLGRLCLTKNISDSNIEIQLDLQKGLYFLSINWDDGHLDREHLVVQ